MALLFRFFQVVNFDSSLGNSLFSSINDSYSSSWSIVVIWIFREMKLEAPSSLSSTLILFTVIDLVKKYFCDFGANKITVWFKGLFYQPVSDTVLKEIRSEVEQWNLLLLSMLRYTYVCFLDLKVCLNLSFQPDCIVLKLQVIILITFLCNRWKQIYQTEDNNMNCWCVSKRSWHCDYIWTQIVVTCVEMWPYVPFVGSRLSTIYNP